MELLFSLSFAVVICVHCAVCLMIPCIFLGFSTRGFNSYLCQWIPLSLPSSCVRALDRFTFSISFSAVHSLARLLDGGQYGIVGERGIGGDVGGLGLEVHVEGLDAWVMLVASSPVTSVELIPSSFLRTRSTAPEHPPQVMVTLNLYWWSDILCGAGRCRVKVFWWGMDTVDFFLFLFLR